MSEQLIISQGTKINDYQIVDLIGAGRYGGIYKVKNIKNNQMYAMKTEKIDSRTKQLETELQILKQLNEDFFPKVEDFGTNSQYNINYLITNIYGVSINTIQLYHQKSLDRSTVYSVCYQMLQIIQIFHSCGFVHCDIKPSIFLIQNKKNFPIVLSDFRSSQKFIDPATNKTYPIKNETVFSRPTRYASISVCKGCSYGRKDDIISWFYTFLDLYCGFLPWDKTVDMPEMLLLKKNLKVSSLNPKFPKEVTTLHKFIQKLKYGKRPNYDYINQLFLKCMEQDRVHISRFDWCSFYTKHSNLDDLARELSMKQLRINAQKEKKEKEHMEKEQMEKEKMEKEKAEKEKNQVKNLKNTSSEPNINNKEVNQKSKKIGSGLHLLKLSKTKGDNPKMSNKNPQPKGGKTSQNNVVKNNSAKKQANKEDSPKNQKDINDNAKEKNKKLPAIPGKLKK